MKRNKAARIFELKERILLCARALVVKKTSIYPKYYAGAYCGSIHEASWFFFGIPVFFTHHFEWYGEDCERARQSL